MKNLNYMMPNKAVIKKFVDDMGDYGAKMMACFDNDYDMGMCLVRMIYENGEHEFGKAYDMVFYVGAFDEMINALMVEVDEVA